MPCATATILLFPLGAITALALTVCAASGEPAAPLLRIGLIADVQYADKEASGNRRYRQAGDKLRAALADFARQRLDFVVDLGDLIDGNGPQSLAEMEQMLALYAALRVPVYHIVGNHDLAIGRAPLLRILGLTNGYYEWQAAGWRFVALDALEISTAGPLGAQEKAIAAEILARRPDLQTYNGALTARQLAWLADRLEEARRCGQRVLVFSHLPTAIPASHPALVPWNYEDLEAVVAKPGLVAAYIAGHHHQGGYAYYQGIHHLTMPGLVEAPEGSNAYGVLEVYLDRLALKGVGTVPDRIMPLTPLVTEAPTP